MQSLEDFIGETITSINTDKDEYLIFEFGDEYCLEFLHMQDCCEHVYIEDIVGDLDALVGSPLTVCREARGKYDTDEWDNVQEWTFYEFATVNGSVTVRWYGTSNGWYSTSVTWFFVPKKT